MVCSTLFSLTLHYITCSLPVRSHAACETATKRRLVPPPDELTYVNLVLNPERYTGYGGQSARRIWQAMYDQSCFQGE